MRTKGTRTFRGSLIIAIIAVPLFVLAERFEIFEWLAERTGGAVHVFDGGFLLLAFGTFFWRRWKELRAEITELNQVEEALRESEKRFRLLAENIDEVFWLLDPMDYHVLYVSPAYEERWQRTCES
ncbi:MAG: hypothetical protein IIA23_00550, partial [Chloroflexi bacterium]|nr:hypothetical protein [Chloroflexota bacterium]